MKINILTLFPDMFQGAFSESIIKRSIEKGIVQIDITNIRDFADNKHNSVDDYPFGGEAGMVMMAGPIVRAIEHLQKQDQWDEIIFLTPDGKTLDQPMVNNLSLNKNMILLCGHYKGIDQRVRDHWITQEISIGDYVLSGGELAAMVIVDAVVRLIPGVLNDETSALSDSFQNQLLSSPVYTRPADFRGHKVPDILLSGHQKKIDEWKYEQALKRTQERKPDLLK
ncbi:MAG: tRNA (guanosine(37)-N1)-methyltransferase TrmD [Bacteroidales bacterium]|nr:tRNA (guanosine(37)-N1)-methyltransferase TrmD [Bacteroidales bacterium]